jgi:hypothetical protein
MYDTTVILDDSFTSSNECTGLEVKSMLVDLTTTTTLNTCCLLYGWKMMPQAPIQSRRVFRGRGGPTDGCLPPKKKKYRAVRYVAAATAAVAQNGDHHGDHSADDLPHRNDDEDKEDESSYGHHDNNILAESVAGIEHSRFKAEDKDEAVDPCAIEMRHLHQRIRHIRNAMTTLSAKTKNNNAVVSITHYSANVLNAISNAVVEWRAIYRRYNDRHQHDCHDDQEPNAVSSDLLLLRLLPEETATAVTAVVTTTSSSIRETGNMIFGMIQQGLQSGPLTGSQPGYCKRCGSDTSALIHAFLIQVGYPPGFSDPQRSALEKWTANAAKAMVQTKAPSRSVQKKMRQSTLTAEGQR